MGERVEFPSNAHTCQGYLSKQTIKRAWPALVVIQEWWGLVPHIQKVVDRFAGEGFLAIAPDLYHGKTTKSPNEASRLLMELDVERANSEIAGAGEYLLGLPEAGSKKFGVVGFCMGGALAQYAATSIDKIGAAVSFYGGFKKVPLNWDNLKAPLLLIFAENDLGVPSHQGLELEKKLRAKGKTVDAVFFPDADHAFFNDTGPNYNAKAADAAWARTIQHLRQHLR